MTGASWRYIAANAEGRTVSGHIDEADRQKALAALRARRLEVIALSPAGPSLLAKFTGHGQNLSTAELAKATRRLSDLLGAGLPLAHALRIAVDQADTARLRLIFEVLFQEVRSGKSLSAALAAAPLKAPRLFLALVSAGEEFGALAEQFKRLATHYEEGLKLRREIVAQLIYPAALVVLVVATMLFLSFFVLPQFQAIFTTADARPPPETRFVLGAGAFIRNYWWGVAVAAIVVILSAPVLATRYAAGWEAMRLDAPLIGKVLFLEECAQYCRTLAALTDGGMPLASAMPLARAAVTYDLLRQKFETAENAVRAGSRLAPALARSVRPPNELLAFIEVGEETGALPMMLGQAAGAAENEVRAKVKAVMLLAAPVLTALMGVLTAGVIAAVMTGVLSLNEAIY